ncbi:MAG: esterase family protein [Oscillospiraceae bacterium]|jgi:enterochelin esterase-like enzyme|nr:esterase family protein [Oscillospiraceae bacterium]
MKGLSVVLLCAVLLAGCGKTDAPDEPPTSQDTSGQSEEVRTEEDTQDTQNGGEVVNTDDIGLQKTLDYFANLDEFQPPDGFDKRQDGTEYGEYAEVEYYSETTGNTRKCYVYTPPNYDENKTYPVLYLLHGIGGTHVEWNGGKPNEVISNLIAAGDAPPMIVVAPNIRAMYDDQTPSNIFSEESIAAFDNFINDLRDDLMPFIKENYSVSEKRGDTAVAGLSMGGREALFIGVSMPETFAYVGAFCPAPGLMGENLGIDGQITPEEMTLPDEYKGNTFILINAENQDGVVGDNPLNYSNAFRGNGVENVYYSIEGGHDFTVWKNGLYFFARSIFD